MSTLSLDTRQGLGGRVVDVRQEVPEPWATAMMRRGAVTRDGRASYRRLAELSGVAPETIRRLALGKGTTSEDTLAAVAKTLEEDVTTVAAWAGKARAVARPYSPPSEANLLTARQRRALDELIRAMAEREEVRDGRESAPTRDDHTLAAHRGRNLGREMRKAHDQASELPDEPGPEEGA